MMTQCKIEWLKEKRGANRKMLLLIPAVFILFSFAMSLLMGESPRERSYLMATAFNWYPLMILPIVISLLVTNIQQKEKPLQNQLYLTHGASLRRRFLGKQIVVLGELAFILLISSLLILLLNSLLFHDYVPLNALALATLCLFFGSLPLVGISFFFSLFTHRVVIVLGNFLLSFAAAVAAVTKLWLLFPWDYSIRMMAPILGIHPNGTFLPDGDSLLAPNAVPLGIAAGIIVYLIFVTLGFWKGGKRHA